MTGDSHRSVPGSQPERILASGIYNSPHGHKTLRRSMGCPAQNHLSLLRQFHRTTLRRNTKLWRLLDHLQAHDYTNPSALVSVHFLSGRSKHGHLRDSSPDHIRTNMAKTRLSSGTSVRMHAAQADNIPAVLLQTRCPQGIPCEDMAWLSRASAHLSFPSRGQRHQERA